MKKRLYALLVMAIIMSLFVACGSDKSDSKKGKDDVDVVEENDDSEETVNDANVESAFVADTFTEKKVEISFNATYCEKLDTNEFLLSLLTEEDGMYDIEFYDEYTANSYYQEQVAAFGPMGFEATDLEEYTYDGKTVYGFAFMKYGEKNSQQLMYEVENGILIIHHSDIELDNKDVAKTFVEKVFVEAIRADEASGDEATSDVNNNKTAVTNEEKANVYKTEYDAIKDKIVEEVKDGSETSYLDASGNEIMYLYYNGENIENAFFNEFYDSGVKKSSRVYTFDENGEYSFMDLEFHENGKKRTETVYNDDGSKLVFSFDEEGDYVSGTEYDKNGNVIE